MTKVPRALGLTDLVLLKIVAIVNINNVPPVAVDGWTSLVLWMTAVGTSTCWYNAGQDVFAVDLDEVVQRRGIGDNDDAEFRVTPRQFRASFAGAFDVILGSLWRR